MGDYSNITDKELLEILDHTGLDYNDRQDWIYAGAALHSDARFRVWDEWSARSPKYNQAEMSGKWRSFENYSGERVEIRTLIYMAKENGFALPTKKKYDKPDLSKMTWEEIENDIVMTDNGFEFKEPEPVFDENAKVEGASEPVFGEIKKGASNTTQHNDTLQKKFLTKDNNITKSGKKREGEAQIEKIIKALESDTGTFTADIDHAQARLYDTPEALKYYEERGIDVKTLLHYQAGWSDGTEKWNNRHIKGAMIPGTHEGLAIRNVNYESEIEEFNKLPEEKQKALTKSGKAPRKYFKPSIKNTGAIDIPVGLKHVIKQPDLTDPETGYKIPIFIFEGYVDVMSLYEATKIDGISLNGTGNANTVIQVLKHYEIDRPVIVALDNDETGIKNQQKRYEEIKNAGLEVYAVDQKEFYGAYKDANEYLVKDFWGFIEAVESAKTLPIAEYEKDFNAGQLESFNKYIEWTRRTPPIKTGFPVLDGEGFLDGGLYPELYGIGALSSLGKTSLILQIADNIAKSGHDVLYISLEMLGHELRAKSISRYTLKESYANDPRNARTTREILDGKRYSEYSEFQQSVIERAKEKYFKDTGKNMKIVDFNSVDARKMTFTDIEFMVKKHVAMRNCAPVVFVDYLQILGQDEAVKHSMSDKQIVDDNILKLKRLSTHYQTPVVVISSFNRANYNNPVTMESFKESGAIEYSCGVLIGLDRDITIPADTAEDKESFVYMQKKASAIEKEERTGIKHLKLVILKNRNGKSGGQDLFTFDQAHNFYYEKGDIKDVREAEQKAMEERLKKLGTKKVVKAK